MMKETRRINLNEELDRISRENCKVQLFINEHYSFLGTILVVHNDFIRGKEEETHPVIKIKNPYVTIPIEKIQYVRLLK